jgi:hypothetical protein
MPSGISAGGICTDTMDARASTLTLPGHSIAILCQPNVIVTRRVKRQHRRVAGPIVLAELSATPCAMAMTRQQADIVIENHHGSMSIK